MRPLALDLFCGAGGASMGLYRAGFDVIGLDIKPQPRYPFTLVRGDALAPPFDLARFDFVWASPVCKRYTDGASARMAKGAEYPNQIPAVREMLRGHPLWAIENVMKAPLRPDIVLHGHMFPELRVIRRRKFEVSWGELHLLPPLPKGLLREGYFCVVGNGTPKGVREMGLPDYTAAQTREAMGTPWMTRAETCQAIPPAYSEFIGRAALRFLDADQFSHRMPSSQTARHLAGHTTTVPGLSSSSVDQRTGAAARLTPPSPTTQAGPHLLSSE